MYLSKQSLLGFTLSMLASLSFAQEPFDYPKAMISKFSSIAEKEVVGRIRRIDPWENYAKRSSTCIQAPMICAVLAAELRVAVVDIMRFSDSEVSGVVIIHIRDRLAVGDYVKYRFPKTISELAAITDRVNNEPLNSVPTCQWSKNSNSQTEGVVCDSWNYATLDYPWW
jgi:hypothetical protein